MTIKQHFKALTINELKAEHKNYYASVYIDDCFGTKDLIWLQLIERELDRRGYEVIETPRLPKIVKANLAGREITA